MSPLHLARPRRAWRWGSRRPQKTVRPPAGIASSRGDLANSVRESWMQVRSICLAAEGAAGRWVQQRGECGVEVEVDFGARFRWEWLEGEVGVEGESDVEGELVASGAGGDAGDGGGESFVAGVAHMDGIGPDRQGG